MKLYAQATISISGFRYWFTQKEIAALNQRNRAFEAPCTEEQLISKYYALTDTDYSGTWVNAATILEKINGGIKKPLSNQRIGKVMKKLGYSTRRINGINKYHVKELQFVDIQENKRKELAELDSQPF